MLRSKTLLQLLLVSGVVWTSLSGVAAAQAVDTVPAVTSPFTLPSLPSLSGLWTVTIGGQAALKPGYEGAKEYNLGVVPIFSIHRSGSADQFRSPIDSPSITLFELGDFRAGPVASYVPARIASQFHALTGLGDVNATYEVGGFVEYFALDWVRARVEVRRGFRRQRRRIRRCVNRFHRATVARPDQVRRAAGLVRQWRCDRDLLQHQ
jgi:outer membrane scaffolding protein for murein synthesis (MipA/OmpV family)